MDLNQFIKDVHQNAVAHGWHDKERSDGTMRSLFHCELSEAVESYRKGEPDWWHRCPYAPGACETQEVHANDALHCEACSDSAPKPKRKYTKREAALYIRRHAGNMTYAQLMEELDMPREEIRRIYERLHKRYGI